MSKITNDGLTRSDTGCFIAVPIYGNSGHQTVSLIIGIMRVVIKRLLVEARKRFVEALLAV